MKKKIAIIGAGIAGLTLANLIKKYTEHEFIVYEREESLSLEEGYGIQLAANSIKILNQINFNKMNNDKLFNPSKIDFYNIQNEKICDNYSLTGISFSFIFGKAAPEVPPLYILQRSM